jgi:hypothetical protein
VKTYRAKFTTNAARAFALILVICNFSAAQEAPSPKKGGVRIQFLPPPMEGTISVGIYNARGHLVRTLKREADTEEFTVDVDGLVTSWDGNDDAGDPLPAGKYHARGYTVGDVKVEGEAFHCNDWIEDEDSPRIRRVLDLGITPDDDLVFLTRTTDAKEMLMRRNAQGRLDPPQPLSEAASETRPPDGSIAVIGTAELANAFRTGQNFAKVIVADGKISLRDGDTRRTLDLSGNEHAIDACAGRDGRLWVIVQGASNSEVREYSSTDQLGRRLAIKADDPQPKKITGAHKTDTVFLLEETAQMQRVRALVFDEKPAPASSDSGKPAEQVTDATEPVAPAPFKVTFEKTIWFSDELAQVKDKLKLADGKPFVPQEKIAITLRANPLNQDKPGSVELAAGFDANGSFLKTADGLVLRAISETKNLRWVAIGRAPDGKSVTVFQSDGAVVEQFKASKLADMMAFDCGEFDYDPKSAK